jgi:hypothetical protein
VIVVDDEYLFHGSLFENLLRSKIGQRVEVVNEANALSKRAHQ